MFIYRFLCQYQRSSLQCPVVVSLHDLYPYDEPDNFGFPRVFFNRVFLHQCLKRGGLHCLCLGGDLIEVKGTISRFAHRKAAVVPNCVTIHSIEPELPGVELGRFLLIVAQHRANKNIPLAIKVFEELWHRDKIRRSDVIMLLLGNHGPETATIMALIKQGALEKRVQLEDRGE